MAGATKWLLVGVLCAGLAVAYSAWMYHLVGK